MKQQSVDAGVELKEVTTNVSMMPSPISFTYPCEGEKSAFDVLVSKTTVEAEENASGKRIVGINGNSDGGGRFWIFAVDGRESTVSAEAYNCIGKELISWTLK